LHKDERRKHAGTATGMARVTMVADGVQSHESGVWVRSALLGPRAKVLSRNKTTLLLRRSQAVARQAKCRKYRGDSEADYKYVTYSFIKRSNRTNRTNGANVCQSCAKIYPT
jgi:hypothetical protein